MKNLQKINLSLSNIKINEEVSQKANKAYQDLINKSGKGNDFLGWLNLPYDINKSEIKDIESFANDFKKAKDFIVVIGIGGSYLGAKAVIDALSDNFSNFKNNDNPKIIFAGQNLSSDYLSDIIELLQDKSFGIVVISKSGTTTEPAIAFRLLRKLLLSKFGKEETQKRIVAITDKNKGSLLQLAKIENFRTFEIADDIGGRYSVLSPVGLVPIALAGFNILELINGAKSKETELLSTSENEAVKYAIARNSLYNENKIIEILINYNPKLSSFNEWWKQLFGESEGKEGKGIFPASVNFTTDLHSLGQFIQEGKKQIFETIISINKPKYDIKITETEDNLDKLNYLSGKFIDYINKMAEKGTHQAHLSGNVPIMKIEIPELNEFYLGQLIYFFEFSCAISGYILGVNPFNQPGVEEYKKNMFILLEKPNN